MRYLASVSYDGRFFHGFQRLNNHLTVQGELERVLSKICKCKIEVKGAGRTDRYVHAKSQYVHFDISVNISCNSLKKAMNSLLIESIYINHIKKVNDNFHARFNVKRKTYEYIINIGEYNPLINNYVYNYNLPLNIKKMKVSSKYLLGIHSYEAFTSGTRDDYTSIIYKIRITKKGNLIYFKFIGKSFYRYMIRNLVGGLLLVGSNKITPLELKKMLEAKENIYNYMTVPACGLYLINVEY